MVFFKCFKSNTITILAKEDDAQGKRTTLKLCALLTGPKALVLPVKDNSMYIKSWSSEVSWEVTDFGKPNTKKKEVAQCFVECFHKIVGRSMVHERLVLLEFVFLAEHVHKSVGELFSVVSDDVARHTISMDDMLFDEINDRVLLDFP
ncbi:hypothetical protein D8674_017383 [Pyrus ussuriensis x Pyrus communis]|uniref:Uncharacterized protein n=1 Tax=Pyrus ussuriensis x Pyrus communis TaxID=2448454 RepID=A0A5N5HFA6_9ROSA|nr:hypothetical protein D8674_017247 [Pyrus ussuriensis x Pyrus communis]KAB2625723.1 hypothetical protein D8674_017383 [Pyrus ussuriensis x Pyrus communis]